MTDYIDDFIAQKLDWAVKQRITNALLEQNDDPNNSAIKYAAGFGALAAMLSDNAYIELAKRLGVELS